eukprot:CAMPEP_0174252392 /NCGR_PEP_ID=MMETSP0439-20130205/1880_1 /TAXON_ID=0 /ORGANISM="Stereomyxa ramosa, Strain Chinc5" /LENGTH=754 /DNA_ID=CAMNT_0015332915 /DNA_START=107 /DNA_END=2368 /DNA_ORIENTATION=+
MRKLAVQFARKIQPFRPEEKIKELADALDGSAISKPCSSYVPPSSSETYPHPSLLFLEERATRSTTSFYADPVNGNDNNSGSKSSPFKTLHKAVEVARGYSPATIYLRKGTFYMESTLELSTKDNLLTIQNYPNEEVWLSGGMKISPSWVPYQTQNGKNIYVANLTGVGSVTGLRVNGERMIRARYPNANPEFGFGSNLMASSWLSPTTPTNPDTEVYPDTPFRNTSASFQKYQLGVGGPCQHFTPQGGYWCGNMTEGGGHFTYRVPSGMVATQKVLPNSPYKNATGSVIQTWRPAHWASWMFLVGDYAQDTGTFKFAKGGFQGARGNNNGDNFYIENVFEELDSPGEWFFDEYTQQLFLWYNSSGAPKPADEFVVTNLKIMVSLVGSQSSPVKNVLFQGLGFRDAAYTYLDPHGMPSGGDWGLQRTGAVYLEGTENVVIDSCTFLRVDGNAVMISGYNRHATVSRSEFAWIGDTAIASWGNAVGSPVEGMGWDGTNGDQPRFNQILYNFVHELGIWEKQSSMYFQAKTCQANITGNIFFNGPRAGINFNDGFGGGANLTENILFNTCRESGDHGPFNSWDRQVYVTKVRNGTASVVKEWDYISRNFIIANYNGQEAVDNDDGSCYYKTHDNFFAYSGNGMKSDFGGHDNHHFNNFYAFCGRGFGIDSQYPGHNDYFYNNSVVMTGDGNYGDGQTCSGPSKTIVHDNKIFSPKAEITECGSSLADWQAKGNDPRTTSSTWPSDDQMLKWIKNLL